jgi:hypothetical protein
MKASDSVENVHDCDDQERSLGLSSRGHYRPVTYRKNQTYLVEEAGG